MNINDLYSEDSISCKAPLSMTGVVSLVVVFCLSGILWAIRNVRQVININLDRDMDIDLDDQESISY
jgi:uncharacterized membrane protein